MHRTPDMFPGTKPPRAKPRVMMHLRDAGQSDGRGPVYEYECGRCGHNTGWIAKPDGPRGGHLHHRVHPCPNCNQPKEDN